ncbi:hypothetical protein GALL_234860 [mine drainage metagenome]|uniref:ABC transporter substrate-binding protein n=1 Tax=mine drainage metagenome TaxID=410659 RepID=A0A1J5RFH5_9ZZZZ
MSADIPSPFGDTTVTSPFGGEGLPRGGARGWDFLGTVPVPVRQPVRDGVAALLAAQGGLRACMPQGQGSPGPFQRLRFIRTLAEYPGLLVSSEQGNAFNRAFHRRHVEGGAFSGCQPETSAAVFTEAGLIDPKGWIGVYAVAPFVLLADRAKLGPLPLPGRWADLLEPCYRGQVVFSGWRPPGPGPWRQLNHFFLLAMARKFGLEGLERLLANVPTLLHSAQMPRLAGSEASVGGLYVLPWSLADLCPRRAATQVIWPADGALAYPLWLTAQQARRPRLEGLIRHFHGPGLAALLNHNRYPALCPDLPPALPPGARLAWPGWEAVRHPATARLGKSVRALAARHLERTPCG